MAGVKRKLAPIKKLTKVSPKKSRIEMIAEEIADEIHKGNGSILDLPPEVFEIVLKNLNLKEIGNCALTCEGLKQKIEAIFKNKCKFYYITLP